MHCDLLEGSGANEGIEAIRVYGCQDIACVLWLQNGLSDLLWPDAIEGWLQQIAMLLLCALCIHFSDVHDTLLYFVFFQLTDLCVNM